MKKLLTPLFLLFSLAAFCQSQPPRIVLSNDATLTNAKYVKQTIGDSVKIVRQALATKQPLTNFKTVNGQPIVGSGDLQVAGASTTDTASISTTVPLAASATKAIVNNLYVNPALIKAALNTSRSISAPTTIAATDNLIVVTSGTFTQPLPDTFAGGTVAFYNQGSGTITFTATNSVGGFTTAILGPGNTSKGWTSLQFTFLSTGNYLAK